MPPVSIPTTSALSSAHRIPSSHPAVIKILSRLSRPSLLSLVLDWLDERNQENTAPYLVERRSEDGEEDEDAGDLYQPASSLDALRETYADLQSRKGSKRDVVDRLIEGDWRHGISLYQLAMADMQYLYDHPSSQKWSALKIVRLTSEGQEEEESPAAEPRTIPRFHPATFLRNLQKEILPDVKAHYNLDRHATLPLLLLRIFLIESPYNTSLVTAFNQQTLFDSSKTFYVAFPDDSPYVYVSLQTSPPPAGQPSSRSDNRSLRNITLGAIPKAFSRPRERYTLKPTSFSTKNLQALVERRGGGRTNAAGGGWGIYAEKKKGGADNPLKIQLPTPQTSSPDPEDTKETEDHIPRGMKRSMHEDERSVKRRKLVAQGRFGKSAKGDDGKGIERLDIRFDEVFSVSSAAGDVENDYPLADELGTEPTKQKGKRSTINLELDKSKSDEIDEEGFRPDVRVTFHGQHVFAGIRELIEAGVIDGEKMPGWMTGEEGVSVGIVRDGRIQGNKGSGL
ncbi:Uncharacterized protein BP5553_05412 [Venustampulla echinocandica]|uniref:CHL4-domain-containing protein n=1 Tax=Venustampulla echinocandica TaxID=2656787 RepID=A0A370TR36_9HELO|nr:Uncharacterized protein BP5553_05412 [Venustampulla echinocandica]RDL37979.1 Uncharacterized protein BP5553_05412 [Venustampulla echinocandica]